MDSLEGVWGWIKWPGAGVERVSAPLSSPFCSAPTQPSLSCWPTAALDQTSWYTIWVWLTLSLLLSATLLHSTVNCWASIWVQEVLFFFPWKSLLKLNNSVKWRWACSQCLIQMFFSCTRRATSYSYTWCRSWNSLLKRGLGQCRHYSSVPHESQVSRKRIPGIPLWLAPALVTTVTKQAEGGGTGRKGHPSC